MPGKLNQRVIVVDMRDTAAPSAPAEGIIDGRPPGFTPGDYSNGASGEIHPGDDKHPSGYGGKRAKIR
jgi:hypothetical protein